MRTRFNDRYNESQGGLVPVGDHVQNDNVKRNVRFYALYIHRNKMMGTFVYYGSCN